MKKILKILTLISIAFLFKSNVYADDNFCAYGQSYVQLGNLDTSRGFGVSNSYCTTSGFKNNNVTFDNNNIIDFNVFDINFKFQPRLYTNNNYDQTPYTYYVLLYNEENNVYHFFYFNNSDVTLSANATGYRHQLFSLNDIDIFTFNTSNKTIYMSPGYENSYRDNNCIMSTNLNSFKWSNFMEEPVYCENSSPEESTPEEPETPVINEILDKVYVPNYKESQCVEIIDKDTIRVFENEETINYIDYYINSNYISKQGQVEQEYVKNCSSLLFTDKRYYGNDFPQILFIFLSLTILSTLFLYKFYRVFRKR